MLHIGARVFTAVSAGSPLSAAVQDCPYPVLQRKPLLIAVDHTNLEKKKEPKMCIISHLPLSLYLKGSG